MTAEAIDVWPDSRRKSVRRSAEGTLANIGVVVHSPDQALYRCDRKGPKGPSVWSRCSAEPLGPLVRSVEEGAPAPSCIHCGGSTHLTAESNFCFEVEKREQRWECTDEVCLGREDAVIYIFPTRPYDRRG